MDCCWKTKLEAFEASYKWSNQKLALVNLKSIAKVRNICCSKNVVRWLIAAQLLLDLEIEQLLKKELPIKEWI